MRGIFWLAEELLVLLEGLYSKEVVLQFYKPQLWVFKANYITFQFILARILCKKIPVLQGGCVPVFGVPRLLIMFYRRRKWHRWKSLGGSSFSKQFFLLVCKLNQKHWVRGAQTPADLVFCAGVQYFRHNCCISFPGIQNVYHFARTEKVAPDDSFPPWRWALSMKFSEVQFY